MSALRLCHIELPAAPGARLTFWLPAGAGEAFGAEPFAEGQGFTVDISGDRWRAVLLSADVRPEGAEFTVQIEGRYPPETPSP